MSALGIFKTGAVVVLMTLAGCGGGSSDIGTTYTIGGTVLGMKSGDSMEITLGPESLSITANGAFTFSTAVADGTNYGVSVATTPTGQSCGILNGTGQISSANVTNVEVYCTDDVSAATLNGTYEIAGLNVNNDTAQLDTSVPFDGNGTEGASTVTTNTAGTTFTTSANAGAAYTVTTVDALPVLAVGGTNNSGAIAADGDEFYWMTDDVSGGSPPTLFLGVSPLETASLSTLAGNWTIVGLTQAATPYASGGTVAIASDGSFTGSQTTLDSSGVTSTQALSGAAGSYAVANNVVSIGGDAGYISANGEFAMFASVTQQAGGASANYPALIAAVKQGSGVTLATVNGVYSIGVMAFATASTGAGSSLTLEFDGAGNFTGTAAGNDNGSASSGTFSGTYTVTSSGVLTLTDSDSNVYTGAVSADGKVVVAAYLTASADAPQILVGFRQ